MRPFSLLVSFSSKTRTSLKTQLLFYVSEHSNFPAFSLLESCSQTDKFPKNSLHSRISVIVNMLILYLASLLDVLFLQWGLQMYAFQVVSFKIECTVSLSRLAKALNLILLCNLHPRTKELR